MRIGIFVIVAAGQAAELPIEAFSASVVFAWITPAVATPIAKRLDEQAKIRLFGDYCPSLPHGDVMSGIEAQGCKISKCAHFAAIPGRAKSVAAIFDEP